MRVRFLPYKIGSQSCKHLAQELGILRCNPRNTRFVPKSNDLIINWGCSYNPFSRPVRILNHYDNVSIATNKVQALEAMQCDEVSVIPFTTSKYQAQQWLDSGEIVYGRHSISSYGGNGIVIYSGDSALGECPLYTKGIKIRREYRVHVFKGQVIDHVQKRRRHDNMEVSEYIRNHTHGWVFVHQDFNRLEEVEREAIAAVEALGLDFGAVDVITEKHTGKVYVLEVNTAVGLHEGGITANAYINAFREYLQL